MFSPRERTQLRDRLVEAARRDGAITAAALVGSAARDAEDRWSDIDLALRLQPDDDPLGVAERWTQRLRSELTVVDHLDVHAGPALYRVLLLDSTLQVDLSFWPAGSFRATGPAFRLLFGEVDPVDPASPAPGRDFAMAWLYALHTRSALARGRCWQANAMIEGLRSAVIMLACQRHGLPSYDGRGVDDLPPDVTAALERTLVGSVEPVLLRQRFAALVALLIAEVEQTSTGNVDRLPATLHELVRTTPT